jgi:acyl-coenzyme A synthetase/AMP-(fatty) acid ligase
MFLSLDKKNKNSIAILDNNNIQYTYGEIISLAQDLATYFSDRMVVFVLNNNSSAAAVSYLSCMINKVVPLMLSASMDIELLYSLYETYLPSYIWKPIEMLNNGEDAVYTHNEYALISTGNVPYPIHKDLSLLLTTSGSTGSPKLVRHTYANLESQGKNISTFFNLSEKDRPMIDLPINYTFGLSVLNSHLYSGATALITNLTVLSPDYWKFFKENNATSITGVPYTYEILKKLRFFRMDLPSLNLITQGGGKLSNELFLEFAEYARSTGRRFIPTYGQTEGSARMAYLPDGEALSHVGSIGKAIPNGQLYVVDDSGNRIDDLPSEGEMVYEGPNVTMGYAICKDDLTKGDELNGILYTGDIVKRDIDGYFYIIGRKKRFLKLNGYRVGLDECEAILKDKYEI